jgi:aminopeptidase
MSSDFEKKLAKYAELIVKVGLNLQPDQRLFIWTGPLEVAPLVREVTAAAYANGAPLVSVLWVDEQMGKIRLENAPDGSFEEYSSWTTDGLLSSMQRGDAYLQLFGLDPQRLKGLDPDRLASMGKAGSKHYKPISALQSKNAVQWALVAASTPSWASRVFPDLSPQEADERLWQAIFAACRIDDPDPIAVWQQQDKHLSRRKNDLNAKQYAALHFTAPGTDLRVGLPTNHNWEGGGDLTPEGISFMANIPTEEVYTMPHKDKVDGTVTSTKPLSYQGSLIENFSLTFNKGKVINFSAEKGEDALGRMLDTDENARYLGEVALIPHKTPISQLEILFLNTLFDENTSNHLALGSAYRYTLQGGTEMSDEDFAKAGGNDSLIHIDFMFGSEDMNVDGFLADGSSEPLMRAGEWANSV